MNRDVPGCSPGVCCSRTRCSGLLPWLLQHLRFRTPESDAEFWIKLASPNSLWNHNSSSCWLSSPIPMGSVGPAVPPLRTSLI